MLWGLLISGALAALIAVIAYRTATFPIQPEPIPAVDLLPVEAEAAAAHLAAIIQCETISHSPETPPDAAAFGELHARLRAMYPGVYAALEVETINTWSLLFTWRGGDPALDPVVFMGHTDVVPVDPGALHTWIHPPFSGAIAEGFVWGRGTLDVKCQVTGLLDAAAALLAA
ncbi:MAG: M20/M25/M40 family metallo-hydrolase, partial [Anaerolineae bacterium]|nr:M20/M25/M40 family metallo-hydrolase [Anaerolineae bacterium]